MNKDSYEKLPPKVKAAIDQYSYENFSKRMGKVADDMDAQMTDQLTKLPGHSVYKFDAAQTEIVKQKLAPITEAWVAATPDGPKVLAAYRAEIAKIRSEQIKAASKD